VNPPTKKNFWDLTNKKIYKKGPQIFFANPPLKMFNPPPVPPRKFNPPFPFLLQPPHLKYHKYNTDTSVDCVCFICGRIDCYSSIILNTIITQASSIFHSHAYRQSSAYLHAAWTAQQERHGGGSGGGAFAPPDFSTNFFYIIS